MREIEELRREIESLRALLSKRGVVVAQSNITGKYYQLIIDDSDPTTPVVTLKDVGTRG